MSEYFPGDVVLAPVFLGGNSEVKVRPAVVLGNGKINSTLRVCPITSHVPRNTIPIAIELDDFITGGLSLFEESYIIPDSVVEVLKSAVAGKKGVLTKEKFSEIRVTLHL